MRVVTFDGGGWVIGLAALERAGRDHLLVRPAAVDDAVEAVRPERLATLIDTSATTGRPKGCGRSTAAGPTRPGRSSWTPFMTSPRCGPPANAQVGRSGRRGHAGRAPDPVAGPIVDQAPMDTGPAGCWTLRVGRDGRVLRAAGAARRSVELRAMSSAMATVEEGGTDRLDRLDAMIVEPVESVLGRGEPVPA